MMDDSNFEIGEEIYLEENKLDYDGTDRKKVRYIQRYKKEWENDPKFEDWLEPIQNTPYAAYCNVCCTSLTARKKDLMDHGETRKHRRNLVYKRNNPILYQKMMINMREVDASVLMEKKSPWTDDAVEHLIKLIEHELDSFYDINCKKSDIYILISREMNKAGFPCMPFECQKKWEGLRKSYERVLQYQVKGEFKSKFPFFNLIHKFLAKEIDPLGMREKSLCQKLGRKFDPNGPLILDGSLDGTAYATTLVRTHGSTSSSEEIILSSFDINEDQSADHMALNVQDIDLEGQMDSYSVSEPKDSSENREWEDAAVNVLLSVMNSIDFNVNMMGNNGKFLDAFWESVSSDLHDNYCEVTPTECRVKWRQLLGEYKEIFNYNKSLEQAPNKKGRPRRKTFWQHYDSVGHILGKIHSAKKTGDGRFVDGVKSSQFNSGKRKASGESQQCFSGKKQRSFKLGNTNLSSNLFVRGIKQEQTDHEEEMDNESTYMGEMDQQSTEGVDNLRAQLLRVSSRVCVLEKELSKRGSDSSEDTHTHQTQVVTLLSNILEEMKKMNSRKCCSGSTTPRAPIVNIKSVTNATPNFSIKQNSITDEPSAVMEN